MWKIIRIITVLVAYLAASSAKAVVLQKEIHYVKQKKNVATVQQPHDQQVVTRKNTKKKVSTHKVKKDIKHQKSQNQHAGQTSPTRIGYNKIQGFHKISAQPEHSSFMSKPNYPSFFVYSVKDKLVRYVKKTVHSLKHTKYKLGGRKFDADKGVYVLDCSIYVDNLLQEVHPEGFNQLIEATGNVLPTSLSYYNYFTRLKSKNQYWDRIHKVANLQAGDILVFRNKKYRRHQAAGHIMVVMDAPKKSGSSYLVRVADSAPYRHSRDTRRVRHSGIGIGTLVLRVDRKTGVPTAYAWSIGSRWKSNVRFAMARPLNV